MRSLPFLCRPSFAVLLSSLLCSACSLKDNKQFAYHIEGMQPLGVTERMDVQQRLQVAVDSRSTQEVTLKVSGLPAHAHGYARPASGLAPFSTDLVIVAEGGVQAGTYSYVVTGSSYGVPDVEAHGQVTIKEAGCAADMALGFTASYSCSSSVPDRHTVLVYPEGFDQFRIEHLQEYGTTTRGRIDCNTGIITLPSQDFLNNGTIIGSGSFRADTLRLHYIWKTGSLTDSCDVVMYQR